MDLVNTKMLDRFSIQHAHARKSIAAWKRSVTESDWKTKQDMLISFPNAKMIKGNIARFEILHNKYRLVAEVSYTDSYVEVRFIGTHNEYDKIDTLTI